MKKIAWIIIVNLFFITNTIAAERIVNLVVGYKTVCFAGMLRNAIAVNDQIPAPTLHFKEGDRVTINVYNHLDKETAIHWHGILVPWQMDGVEGVTQHGIPPNGVFHYQFTLKQAGTYWYHAHSGLEEQQGLYGGFIIDPPESPTYKYTKDYVVVLSDWSNTDPDQIMANLKKEGDFYSQRFPLQPSLAKFLYDYRKASKEERENLIDDYKMMQQMRMSIYDLSDVAYDAFLMNGHSNSCPWTAPVKVGDIVRLRFIGAGGDTIFHVKISNVMMKMVHVEGNDVVPYEVQDFTIAPGETYDVLVKIQKNEPYIIYAEARNTQGAAYGALITSPDQHVTYMQVPTFPEPLPVAREMMDNMMMGNMNYGSSSMNMSMTSSQKKQTKHVNSMSSTSNKMIGMKMSTSGSMPGMKMDSPKKQIVSKVPIKMMHHDSESKADPLSMSDSADSMQGMEMGSSKMTMKSIPHKKMSQQKSMSNMKMGEGMNMPHGMHMNHSMNMTMPIEPSIIGDRIAYSATVQQNMNIEGMTMHHPMMAMGHAKGTAEPLTFGTKYQNLTASIKTNDPKKPIYGVIKMELFGYMDRFIWFINGVPEYNACPISLEPGKRYRIIFINNSMMHHPMHIHQHWFILRAGHGSYDPLLHTIDVPPGATVTTDVDADSSGQAFFHCHLLYHMVAGMSRVFRYSTLIDITRCKARPEDIVKNTAYFNRPIIRVDEMRPIDLSLINHPMAHPMGFWLSTLLDIGADPFHNAERLTYKGMYGSDYNKLELFINDGEVYKGKVENADIDIFYWHLISQFWAIKGGASYFYRPAMIPYWQPGIGIEGLMPYFIDINIRGYYHSGSTKLDIELSRDTQITNNFFIRGGIRSILASKTVQRDEVGSGLNQMRYIVRPYYRLMPGLNIFAEYEYEQDYGAFRSLHKTGDSTIQNTLTFGLAVLF